MGLGVVLGLTVLAGSSAARRTGSAPAPNPVVAENALPGTTAWRLPQSPGREIEGYASEISVRPGETLHLHVSTQPTAHYRVDIFRIGWYGGTGGRLVACSPGCATDEQGSPYPVPAFDAATGYLDAGWPVTDTVVVGRGWVSGYYLAEFVLTSGPDAGKGGWFPLIVREPPGRDSVILVQAPVNTWEAYNAWGGRSLYFNFTGLGDNHVSFERPFDQEGARSADGQAENRPQTLEFPLVRYLERLGYDISYTTDVDIDADPGELLRHRLALVAGHSEYWTKGIRDGLQWARDLGTNLAFMGANDGFWQIRYADNRRTIVEYRNPVLDPEPNSTLKTTRFRSLHPARPECELIGIQFDDTPGAHGIGGPFDYSVNPAALSDPWFRATGFTASSTLHQIVGAEWDRITANCATPPLTDFFHFGGAPAAPPADSARYTAPSGARVFATGTHNFSKALDDSTGYGSQSLQLFMANAVDDLTRPAAPTGVFVSSTVRGIRVSFRRHPDPRIVAALVFRVPAAGSFVPGSKGARLICTTRRSSCLDRQVRSARPVRYAVVLRDPWRLSSAIFSRAVTLAR
jgi:hypothetical protein